MPEAQHYRALAILVTACTGLVLGYSVWRRWYRVGALERAILLAVFLFSLSVVSYWLLLYKSVQLSGHRTVWLVAWCIALAGAFWIVFGERLERIVPPSFQAGRRRIISNSIVASIGIVTSSRIAAYDPADVVVEQHTVVLPNMPRTADGLVLAILSDIHAGPFIEPKHVAYYASVIRAKKPDMIVLPGDFITAHADELRDCCRALSQLRAPCGVIAVLGNHDYFNNAAPTVTRMLTECGITLLNDTKTTVASLDIFGISDAQRRAVARYRSGDQSVFLKSLERAEQPIVLVHRPFVFDDLAALNPNVFVIAGHTHGGQLCIPLPEGEYIAVNRVFSPYVRGWYRRGTAQLYITRGVGTIGVPVRIGSPPEISFITLRRSHGS